LSGAFDQPTLITAALPAPKAHGIPPVSSTGHLIVAGSLAAISASRRDFEIVIQPARSSPCWNSERLLAVLRGIFSDPARSASPSTCRGFLPAVLGLAFNKIIKAHLFAPVPVACAFVAGAFVILWAERRQRLQPSTIRIVTIDDMRWTDALKVGCAQALALIPGTSRSGATIIGGMLFGLSRVAATEFSFFLAIPTLFAATAYSLWKDSTLLASQSLPAFGVGFAAAFVSPSRASAGLYATWRTTTSCLLRGIGSCSAR
jgi:undecaprenyl-diphosphatase